MEDDDLVYRCAADTRPYLRQFDATARGELARCSLTDEQVERLENLVAHYLAWRQDEQGAPGRAEARQRWERIAANASRLADDLGSAFGPSVTTEQFMQAVHKTESGDALIPLDSLLSSLRQLADAAAIASKRAHDFMPATKPLTEAPRKLARLVADLVDERDLRAVLEVCFRLADEPERDVTPLIAGVKKSRSISPR